MSLWSHCFQSFLQCKTEGRRFQTCRLRQRNGRRIPHLCISLVRHRLPLIQAHLSKMLKTWPGSNFSNIQTCMFILLNWPCGASFLQTRPMENFSFYSHLVSYTYAKIIRGQAVFPFHLRDLKTAKQARLMHSANFHLSLQPNRSKGPCYREMWVSGNRPSDGEFALLLVATLLKRKAKRPVLNCYQ